MATAMRQFVLLTAVSSLVFLTNLGVPQLWDEDEPIFAGAAQEMLERGEWIVPYFNGQMLPDKPVLTYWVMLAAYKTLGVNEWAARLGPALFAWGGVLLVWQLGRKLFSPAVGVWAGVILATSLGFDVVARAATPDTLLSFFSTLALLAFAFGATPPSGAPLSRMPGWLAFAASYAAMGFAVLAKGPIGCLLPTATTGLFLLIANAPRPAGEGPASAAGDSWKSRFGAAFSFFRRSFAPGHFLKTIWSLRPLTAIAAIAAVAGPWYSAVGAKTGGQWLTGFLGVHNLGRFLHPMEHHRGPIFYYLIAIAIGFFPWSLFAAPVLGQLKARLAAREDRRLGHLFLACWAAVYLGFFSLAATKLPNYIVPAYPALALLAAVWIEAWLSQPHAASLARKLRPAWITLGLVGVGVVVGLPLAARYFLDANWALGLAGIPLIAAAAACWRFSERGESRKAAIAFGAAAVAFPLSLFGGAAVAVGRHQTSARFAELVHRHATGEAPAIRACGYYRPSLVFYAREPVRQLVEDEQVCRFFREHEQNAFLFTTGERYERFAAQLPADVCVLDRQRWFLRSNQVLLLGRPHSLARSKSPSETVP
ncbi:MAG TPA: glycosyltransferase family 39 protein [Pirellulales bacterium]|nr:glycosyltransferase family 39 protein [Pirellulales bacterium]